VPCHAYAGTFYLCTHAYTNACQLHWMAHAREAMGHKGGRAVRRRGPRARFAHAGASGRPTAAEQCKVHLSDRAVDADAHARLISILV
jgi:hypothetical protein